jgi:site-specific DNA-cytosine methylase
LKPICIDLYCGLGGWSEGFLSEGYECHGYDIEAHDYGTGGYPGTLHVRDIREIYGSEFKDVACIVGSSPCQKYSYMAMPWSRAN